MYLENLVVDAVEPQRLGRFWEAALGTEQLTDEPDGYETRLGVEGGPVLDLCFQRVPDPPAEPPRLHVQLAGVGVERLLALGARRLDAGLADPEGNPFQVQEGGEADGGPLAALRLDSAEPDRDAAFWAWLTGWTVVVPRCLRHPSLRGVRLELGPEPGPKRAKNRLHLDLRLEAGDDADGVAAAVAEHGGREVHHPEWGELPWRFYEDPSGNEFCVLRAPSA